MHKFDLRKLADTRVTEPLACKATRETDLQEGELVHDHQPLTLGEGISPLTDHVLRVQAQSRMQIQHMKAVRNCLLQL